MSDFGFILLLFIVGLIVIVPFFSYRDATHDREFCQHINNLAFSNYSSSFDTEMIAFKKISRKMF